MSIRTVLVALAATVSMLVFSAVPTAWAQDQPDTYASTYCIKATPGNGQEFEQFAHEVATKLWQVRLQDKRITGWSFNRAVTPAGEEARCSHLLVYFYQGAPSEPGNQLEAELKKAGLRMTPREFTTKRNSLSKLVLHERWVRFAGFSTVQKGDYFQINFMKPLPGKGADFRKFEREVWLPLAQEAAKSSDHTGKAWSGWARIYPAGTGSEYDDVTVDVFRDWASIWKPQGYSKEVVDKVFPGKTQDEVLAPIPTLRNLVRRELYVVVDNATSTGQ